MWPGTAEELAEKVQCTGEKPRCLAGYYVEYAALFELRADIAWAMMRVETGDLSFGGKVPASANNFCGLRLPDGSGFYKFPTALDGVVAHLAHLAWHVYPDHHGPLCYKNNDPKHGPHANDMRVVRDLDIWAGGSETYAASIVRRCNE